MWAALRSVGSICLKREGLAFVALIALILGAAVQTALLTWIIPMLAAAGQWAGITNIAYGLLATVAIVLLSLTLLLGRRSLELAFGAASAKMNNGDGE